MRIFVLTIIVTMNGMLGFSQVNSNPFEIQSRLDSVYNSESNKKGSETNIFDVVRSDDNTTVVDTTQRLETSSIEQSDLVPSVGEELINENEGVEFDQNPFDVSHIPIRKSKLKSEADAFTSKNKASKDKNESESNAFLFFLNLLTGLILAIVINTQRGALKKIFNAITNENVLKLIHREEKRGISGYHALLYASYFINAAIFIYLIVFNFSGAQGWMAFQGIFLAIVTIYLLRHVFIMLIGKIFPFQKDSQLFGFTIQTFNIFLGIVLIPFNLIIAFGPQNIARPLIYFGLVIIAILALIRTFRGFLIASTYVQSNLFHFLLYLCTFEILPILLLLKIIGNFGIA
ncbi:MAG: DUF4271 domain-containing protein [Saprospiraceae bacterium]|nr:DUF4271 domain-containing protein [Saprospiraceae bacterium]